MKKDRVPILRFLAFEDLWTKHKIGELFFITAGGDIDPKYVSIDKTEIFKYPVYANAEKNKGLYGYSSIYKVDGGVVTVAGRGVNLGIAHARDHKFYPIVRLLVLKPKIKCEIKFFEYALNRLQIHSESTGVPQLTAPQISSYEVSITTLPEQEKIAAFLSAVDEKIQQLTQKKHLLEQYKKGLMQKIFSREIRFKDENGKDFPEWEEKQLHEILKEHRTKNQKLKYKEVFSVAKGKGVINQIEHLGRSYASDDLSNYKVAYPYDIIYTKSPTSDFPMGIIKQNKLNRTGVVSVLYGVFTPETTEIGYLLDAYFSNWVATYNYLKPLVRKGAKNTMNIGNDEFLNGEPILLPTAKAEQKKLAEFLSCVDRKIEAVDKGLHDTNKWKKGLLQKMFV